MKEHMAFIIRRDEMIDEKVIFSIIHRYIRKEDSHNRGWEDCDKKD